LTAVPIEKQVINPVAAFASDNNGMSLSFPAVAAAGANSLTGTLTFGVGTHADNQIDSAAVYTTNAALNVRSTFNNAQFSYSFIDSGSNGLFVPDSSIASYGGWFNPATQTPLSATILGYNSVSGVVGFDIVSIQSLTNGIHAASVGADTTLAGNVATDVKRPLSC
jgi:hypothetical protein